MNFYRGRYIKSSRNTSFLEKFQQLYNFFTVYYIIYLSSDVFYLNPFHRMQIIYNECFVNLCKTILLFSLLIKILDSCVSFVSVKIIFFTILNFESILFQRKKYLLNLHQFINCSYFIISTHILFYFQERMSTIT